MELSSSRKLIKNGYHSVYADAESSWPIIDVHKESKKSGSLSQNMAGQMVVNIPTNEATPRQLQEITDSGQREGIPLDFQRWLPFAAPKYHISSDPNDYLIVPVIAVPTDLPNRNRIAFPLKELLAFDPEYGQQSYKTWVGKPTFREHKNDVIEDAYGVIIDTSLVKLRGWSGDKIWKVLMLLAFDRSKYTDYVNKIAVGEENSYSMGAWVKDYTCSVCDGEVGRCHHIEMQDRRHQLTAVDGKLAFKNCHGIIGFECSSVGTPAWTIAISDDVRSLT